MLRHKIKEELNMGLYSNIHAKKKRKAAAKTAVNPKKRTA
jgi:hypothetical protein